MPTDTHPTERTAPPRLTPLGLGGMLVTFADELDEAANRAALAFRARVDDAAWDGVTETATSLCSAFVAFDPGVLDHAALRGKLEGLLEGSDWSHAPLPAGRTRWIIPACFEGDHAPQLGDAAERAGVSPERAVEEICARPLRALALGYAPGQAYLGTLPEHWNLGRQSDLTPNVEEGAIIVAVRQVIVFATSGPTGWRQIGKSRFRGFRPESRERPIALAPGDEVRLRAISADAFKRLDRDDPDGGAEREEVG